jgi:hypothetical protein
MYTVSVDLEQQLSIESGHVRPLALGLGPRRAAADVVNGGQRSGHC